MSQNLPITEYLTNLDWFIEKTLPKGDKGDAGINGIDGQNGTTGAQGIQGFKGNQGDAGTNGIDGLQGQQGIQGESGTNGINGLQGGQGIQGDSAINFIVTDEDIISFNYIKNNGTFYYNTKSQQFFLYIKDELISFSILPIQQTIPQE